jgi:hypothetical protein
MIRPYARWFRRIDRECTNSTKRLGQIIICIDLKKIKKQSNFLGRSARRTAWLSALKNQTPMLHIRFFLQFKKKKKKKLTEFFY